MSNESHMTIKAHTVLIVYRSGVLISFIVFGTQARIFLLIFAVFVIRVLSFTVILINHLPFA